MWQQLKTRIKKICANFVNIIVIRSGNAHRIIIVFFSKGKTKFQVNITIFHKRPLTNECVRCMIRL